MTGLGEDSATIDEQAARVVVDIATGTWRAQAMYAAAALRLADIVVDGYRQPEQLAQQAAADPDALCRLMRLLTAMGVFDQDPVTGYELTAVGNLLRSDVPGSMRDLVLLYGEEFHQAWGAVVPAVRSGTSGFAEALGMPLHQYLRDTPGVGRRFQRAMNAGNVFFPAVLEAYDFTDCRTVVDVAGGSGMLLATVLNAHEKLHGVLVEVPHMVPVAAEYLDSTVGSHRYQAVAGDAFAEVPPGADVYLLSRVLQDWSDDDCVRLLSSIRRAMTPDSRLLILERVIGDGSRILPLLWDLHLHMAAGGRERTAEGYRSVLERAALRLSGSRSLPLETTLLIAEPTSEPTA